MIIVMLYSAYRHNNKPCAYWLDDLGTGGFWYISATRDGEVNFVVRYHNLSSIPCVSTQAGNFNGELDYVGSVEVVEITGIMLQCDAC